MLHVAARGWRAWEKEVSVLFSQSFRLNALSLVLLSVVASKPTGVFVRSAKASVSEAVT